MTHHDDDGLLILRNRIREGDPLPIPVGEFAMYQQDAQQHLKTGQRDFDMMSSILADAGILLEDLRSVLELGCANARILRHFAPLARQDHTKEFWGCDINSAMLMWCHENLSPPFRFFVNVPQPHLPFSDRYFDFIYAYSIFTHIDDLFHGWLLELRRVLRPEGIALLTILDEVSVQIGYENPQRIHIHRQVTRYPEVFQQFLDGEIDMVMTMRGLPSPLIFVRRDYFLSLVQTDMKVLSVTERTMGQSQTAVLMQRLSHLD